MKKISMEVFQTTGERATVILPEQLSPLEILGIAEQLLIRLGLPTIKISLGETNGKEE